MTTWRKEIEAAMAMHDETLGDAEAVAIHGGPAQLDVEFNEGYGGSEGVPFTVWTAKWVYFPAVYDGAEWCASVARNPDGNPTGHVGGQ